MKLLTHNMLTSKCLKGVNVGYPLGIVVSMCYVVLNCHTVLKIRREYFMSNIKVRLYRLIFNFQYSDVLWT